MNCIEVEDIKGVKRIVKGGCDPNFTTDDGIAHSPIYLSIMKKTLN